jgi:hypothetical protein
MTDRQILKMQEREADGDIGHHERHRAREFSQSITQAQLPRLHGRGYAADSILQVLRLQHIRLERGHSHDAIRQSGDRATILCASPPISMHFGPRYIQWTNL